MKAYFTYSEQGIKIKTRKIKNLMKKLDVESLDFILDDDLEYKIRNLKFMFNGEMWTYSNNSIKEIFNIIGLLCKGLKEERFKNVGRYFSSLSYEMSDIESKRNFEEGFTKTLKFEIGNTNYCEMADKVEQTWNECKYKKNHQHFSIH